jgi:putative acetyltransferase
LIPDRHALGGAIHIHSATTADLPAILSVLRAAFETPLEAELVATLVSDPVFIPGLSLVAEEDGQIIGHVLFTRLWVDPVPTADAAPVALLTLAPLAVVPSAQGRGVGSALSAAGIEIARAMGERGIVVLGHETYYPRFGFVEARPLGIESPAAWGEIPSANWMALALSPGALGGVEGVARFAPAFDDAV